MSKPSRPARLIKALTRRTESRAFLPLVGLFPFLDYALPIMPNQMLLLGLSASVPRRRWHLTATFALAGGVGALVVAFSVQAMGPQVLDLFLGGVPQAGAAAEVLAMVERFGFAALLVLALLPWPPRTSVLVCALAGLSPLGIGLAVGLGRVVPSAVLALMGAKTPHLLRRWRPAERLLSELEAPAEPLGAR